MLGSNPLSSPITFIHSRTMDYVMPALVDPRPLDPPEENWPEAQSECIVDGLHGIYVPQQFCQRYEKIDRISQGDWDNCLAGPDNESYWDSWDQILSDWTFEEADGNGGVWKISIKQDGDLFQCREFLRAEKPDSSDPALASSSDEETLSC
jgi:hypothetical protein